jgi:hypothetical protein
LARSTQQEARGGGKRKATHDLVWYHYNYQFSNRGGKSNERNPDDG